MKQVDYIIRADYLLTMEGGLDVIRDGAVAVTGDAITEAGTYADIAKKYTSGKTIEGTGRVVFPGLVNTHTHAAMVYFRGLADDMPLKEWLEGHIWPAEAKWLSPGFVSDAVELACIEMIRAGITTYCDMYFYEDAAGKTTERIGMRAVLGSGLLDFPTKFASTTDEYFNNAENFIKNWKSSELIVPCIAPHATYTCGPETYKRAVEVAEKHDIPTHTHLSETKWEMSEIQKRYGRTPVEYLDSTGILNRRLSAAHCVWLTDNDIEILSKRNVGVSHCVESNLKLASGFAPVTKLLKAGIKVGFGTDGCASNNDLNILSEMSTAAKLHKAIAEDPTALNDRTALLMATRYGAETLGLENKTGSIKKGKKADLVMANLQKPHLTPIYDIFSHVVYSMRASEIETVMINGRIVLDNGRLTTADEAEIMHKAKTWQEKIKEK